MKATANNMITLARAELGTTEKAINNVKYNTDYYDGKVSGSQFDWCVVFVWWIFKKAFQTKLFCDGKKTAYVPYVYNWAKKNDLIVTKPKKGDLVIFSWSKNGSCDHIGFVEVVDGDKLITIEGNTEKDGKEGVFRKTRDISFVKAYIRPKYVKDNDSDTETKKGDDGMNEISLSTVKRGSKNEQVKTVQRILYCMNSCPNDLKIDGDFGSITEKYVNNFQRKNGITEDGIVGKNTWNKLLK